MFTRFLTLTLIALPLAACGAVRGNDTGGIIPWSVENREQAPGWAADHCARYGKVAIKTGEVPGYGNYISFKCEWDRRAPRY